MSTVALVVEKAAQHQEVTVRDLFERFLPPDQRVQRLGTVIDPDEILATPLRVSAYCTPRIPIKTDLN